MAALLVIILISIIWLSVVLLVRDRLERKMNDSIRDTERDKGYTYMSGRLIGYTLNSLVLRREDISGRSGPTITVWLEMGLAQHHWMRDMEHRQQQISALDALYENICNAYHSRCHIRLNPAGRVVDVGSYSMRGHAD